MSDKRILGNSGISMTAVGLGCMGFSHAYGIPTEKSEAVGMLRKAFDEISRIDALLDHLEMPVYGQRR